LKPQTYQEPAERFPAAVYLAKMGARHSNERKFGTMTITKQTVADQIAAYLHHELTLAQLVDWAENALLEGEWAGPDSPVLRSVISRLGVADVRTFGLSWEDSEQLLRELGFSVRVEVVAA
jgi:hypothetical protein